MTEDEMVGWYHQLNGHELEQAPGVGDGQGSLVCCSPWGRKESDTNEQLNWLAESNGNWLLKLESIPQSVFGVFLFPQKTLYTKGLRKLLLSQQKSPSERDLQKQGKKNEKLLCIMSDSFATTAHQVPLSMGFSRQEYWSGLPFPLPGNLPNPEIKPEFPAMQADSWPSEPPGKPNTHN